MSIITKDGSGQETVSEVAEVFSSSKSANMSVTMVPPQTDRFKPLASQAEGVDIPKSKDAEGVVLEAQFATVGTTEPQGKRGLAGAMVAAVGIIKSKDIAAFTEADKVMLQKQESVIAQYIGAFLLVGEALCIIKKRELQRILDPKLSFNEYCSKRWGFGQAYAYRLITGYECVKNLKETLGPQGVTVFPTNEAQVRPLASLSPKDQVIAWNEVLKQADGNVTATLVANIVHGSVAPKAKQGNVRESASEVKAKAEQAKLMTIANLVQKAMSLTPAKHTVKKLLDVLKRIQSVLAGKKS